MQRWCGHGANQDTGPDWLWLSELLYAAWGVFTPGTARIRPGESLRISTTRITAFPPCCGREVGTGCGGKRAFSSTQWTEWRDYVSLWLYGRDVYIMLTREVWTLLQDYMWFNLICRFMMSTGLLWCNYMKKRDKFSCTVDSTSPELLCLLMLGT